MTKQEDLLHPLNLACPAIVPHCPQQMHKNGAACTTSALLPHAQAHPRHSSSKPTTARPFSTYQSTGPSPCRMHQPAPDLHVRDARPASREHQPQADNRSNMRWQMP